MPECLLDVAVLLVSLEALNWASSSSTHAVLQSHTGSGSTSPKHSRGGNRTLRGDAGGEKSAENARSHTRHKGNQERCMHTHAHRYNIHNRKQSVNTYKVAQVNLTIITLNDNAHRCWTHRLQCTSHLTWCIHGDWKTDREREWKGETISKWREESPCRFLFWKAWLICWNFREDGGGVQTICRQVLKSHYFSLYQSSAAIFHCLIGKRNAAVPRECDLTMRILIQNTVLQLSYATIPKGA